MELHGGSPHSFANMAAKGRRGGGNHNNNTRGHGSGRGGFGHGQKAGRGGSGGDGQTVTCQLCGKEGHTVLKCYKRFNASFTGLP
jgi:hypothetical protein